VRDAGASRTSVTVGTAPLFAVATALVFLDEPLVGGLVVGASLIVTGGILLASDRARPEHFERIGLVYALIGTIAFATRDTLVRWLVSEVTDVEPVVAAFVTMLTGTAVSLAFVGLRRARVTRRAAFAFVPAGLCYGLSYVFLFEAFSRGRVSVVSPIVATESLWGVMLSWLLLRKSEHVGMRLVAGAVLVVAGGVLIGVYR
jgi:drug/metabolite transporter (DMT)-like permease